jgi:hypothetical protein
MLVASLTKKNKNLPRHSRCWVRVHPQAKCDGSSFQAELNKKWNRRYRSSTTEWKKKFRRMDWVETKYANLKSVASKSEGRSHIIMDQSSPKYTSGQLKPKSSKINRVKAGRRLFATVTWQLKSVNPSAIHNKDHSLLTWLRWMNFKSWRESNGVSRDNKRMKKLPVRRSVRILGQ